MLSDKKTVIGALCEVRSVMQCRPPCVKLVMTYNGQDYFKLTKTTIHAMMIMLVVVVL